MIARSGGIGALVLALVFCAAAQAGALVENFDDISTLTSSGWAMVNNSSPLGTTGWFQGNAAVFSAQAGAADSYVAANWLNADLLGGNVSNWLIMPVMTVSNGAQLTFYTRTEVEALPGDNLEVRLSTNGSSTNVGSTDTSVGDFTTVLVAVPVSGTYPDGWTQYTVTLSGLSGPTDVRIAFRYWITDTTVNGDYIGIDTLQLTDGIPEPSTLGFGLCGVAALLLRRLRAARRS